MFSKWYLHDVTCSPCIEGICFQDKDQSDVPLFYFFFVRFYDFEKFNHFCQIMDFTKNKIIDSLCHTLLLFSFIKVTGVAIFKMY